jgi:uncharacterized protein Smg (DUF494 family)
MHQPTKKDLKRLAKKEAKNQNKTNVMRGYTRNERNNIVTEFYMNLANLDMMSIVTQEMRTILNDYVDNGTEYERNFQLADYQRSLVMRLYNNKNKKSFVNLAQNDVVEASEDSTVGKLRKKIEDLKSQGLSFEPK